MSPYTPLTPLAGDDPSVSHRAKTAGAVAAALLVAMAPVMWAANRSAPLMLCLAALAILLADAVSGRLGERMTQLRACLTQPLALCLVAFLGWSLITLSWSHRPAAGLAMYGELVLPLVAALVLGLGWPRLVPAWAFRALGVALVVTSLLVIGELWAGPGLRDALGLRSQIYIFNRPLLTCLVLLAPVVHGLWRGSRKGDRALAVIAAVSVAGGVMAGESGAAELGLLLLGATWLVALVLPRLALLGVALAFTATLLLAPFIGQLTDRAIPAKVHQQLSQSHSRDRVDIWLSFGEAIAARPLVGSGFGASVAMGTHPVASAVSPPRRLLLDVGHPHSAPVQIWVETGAVGMLLLLAAGLACLAGLRHLPAGDLAPRLALFAGAFGVASVGHGAWQGWWIAILGAAAIWFLAQKQHLQETRR